MKITHNHLVKAAKLWALVGGRCKLVLTEFYGGAGEIPDMIGFRSNGVSVLVECKVSRNDFLGDKKKWHRRNKTSGMGMERWYMVAPDVIHGVEELPDDWGCLMYCTSKHERGYYLRTVRRAVGAGHYQIDQTTPGFLYERYVLIQACARALGAQRLTAPMAVAIKQELEVEGDV